MSDAGHACVQEAYARAWQRWDTVSGYGDPEAWVRTVAYRVSVSAWRKAANMRVAHRRQWAPEDTRGLSPDYVAIIAALRKIPPRQRQAIVLHHLVGQVAIGWRDRDHTSLDADPSGRWLLYLSGPDLFLSLDGAAPFKLTTGLAAAAWT